jgi:hypothetical protein
VSVIAINRQKIDLKSEAHDLTHFVRGAFDQQLSLSDVLIAATIRDVQSLLCRSADYADAQGNLMALLGIPAMRSA